MENLMKIIENTTLSELISYLGGLKKEAKQPTAKSLRENAGEPVAVMEGCRAYRNGYAVYTNDSGSTALWLRDCLTFTYYFAHPRDRKGEEITWKSFLDRDESQG